MMHPGFRAIVVLLLLGASLVSCQTAKFYTQAVRGQWEVLARARPIPKVLAAPETTPELRRKLELVEKLRGFAHDQLKLPNDKQFRSYADLGRAYVVWNVVAAPEFSIEARTWSYPFLGKLKYRGFFTEQAAKDEAAGLKAQGFDVAVGGVRVYSTLGVFSDPVLNTFIEEDEAELAETIFHELTHARFFVAGDTDFNEAYATASAQLGVRVWLGARGDSVALADYERSLREGARLFDLLKETRAKLATLYAARGSLADEALRREKTLILNKVMARYAQMRSAGKSNGTHSKWVGPSLNNARLAALATYHDLVPAFVRLYHEQGGDWEKFHKAVAGMKYLSKEERRERLHAEAVPKPPLPEPIQLDAKR